MNERYFDIERSAARRFGADGAAALLAVAERYLGANPSAAPVFRAWHENGVRRGWDGRYGFAFFGDSPSGARRFAALSALERDADGIQPLSLSAAGRMVLYVDGERAAEIDGGKKNFDIPLKAGWNVLALVAESGECGVVSPYRELRFFMPSAERSGRPGWIWAPLPPEADETSFFRPMGFSEAADPARWAPERAWTGSERARGAFGRTLGPAPGARGLARAALALEEEAELSWELAHEGDCALFLDGKRILSGNGSGRVAVSAFAEAGRHELAVVGRCPEGGGTREWGFELRCSADGEDIGLTGAVPVRGHEDPWLYLGPFAPSPDAASDGIETSAGFDRTYPGTEGPVYWRLDGKGLVLRPYLEAPLFGQWNYPLGVTLYGLIAVGRSLGRKDIVDYVAEHVRLAARFHDLAVWEFERYGETGLGRQMAAIDILDNCGSFGSLLLETARTEAVPGARKVADRIARFIHEQHERLPDGAFYRARHFIPKVVDTLWADDLYMSVPFLLRYYRLTDDRAYLDDAVGQLLSFSKRLYREGLDILSHIFDVKRDLPNGVSWGRGNGWFFFSLAETLSALPENHPAEAALRELLEKTARGYLRLQDAEGLWHQVLTDPSSFPEASCTAMFAYGFARAAARGWLPPDPYGEAARRAWRGLRDRAIDDAGNVYGVCQGSGFSFDPDYYRNELTWILNDTHGTGIVLLAGNEVLGMEARQ